jgi:hypothetical protein
MKELIARGDLQRCLVVCPGSLAEQWQDELYKKFNLPFDILTNDKLEAARTGNWFLETNLAIARLDKLSRNPDVQAKLSAPDCRWDLVVCDEAHKMSASMFGGEIKYTKRYLLGQLLSTVTRHFLLMTATPHNGKEEDFQLFMACSTATASRAARATVPTRRTCRISCAGWSRKACSSSTPPRSSPSASPTPCPTSSPTPRPALYKAVTEYVREEFNRAEKLQNDKRAGTVGFALTILQRRLASSPEAIGESLRRRRERLESRLREMELLQRGGRLAPTIAPTEPDLDDEDVEDLEDAPENEIEAAEAEILDQATAARTIAELKAEIDILKRLESLACRRSPQRLGHEVARVVGPAGRDLHHGGDNQSGRRARGTLWIGRRSTPCAVGPPEAHHLHRASRHAQLPARSHQQPSRQRRSCRRGHPRQHGTRGAGKGAGGIQVHDPTVQVLSPPMPLARASTSSAPT